MLKNKKYIHKKNADLIYKERRKECGCLSVLNRPVCLSNTAPVPGSRGRGWSVVSPKPTITLGSDRYWCTQDVQCGKIGFSRSHRICEKKRSLLANKSRRIFRHQKRC